MSKISIAVKRELIRLIIVAKQGNRAVARITGVSHRSIGRIRESLKKSVLSYTDMMALSDKQLAKLLFEQKPVPVANQKIVPNWQTVYDEMIRKQSVTLALLWQEYRFENQLTLEKTLSYSQFTRLYRAWSKKQPLCMRQQHLPAEKVFVDFCGQTVPVHLEHPDRVIKAQIFVGTLGASNYTFACATPDQREKSWQRCFVEMFNFYRGVTNQIVCDNLKSAVISNNRYGISLNRGFMCLAEHYNIIINPARPRKPQDKSLVELSVKRVQRWILASIRHQKFFSIEELNQAIAKLLVPLNSKHSKKYKTSALQQFQKYEQPKLLPLPAKPFDISDWHYRITVGSNYHLSFKNCDYSVPYQYRGGQVDIRETETSIQIFYGGSVIAVHPLISNSSGNTNVHTLAEHMPKEHLAFKNGSPEKLLEWAKQQGEFVYQWVELQIKTRTNFANGIRNVQSLQSWVRKEQTTTGLNDACKFALELQVHTFQQLKSIIHNKSYLNVSQKTAQTPQHQNVRGAKYYV